MNLLEMKGVRKIIMTIITGLFAIGGLAIMGWLYKDSTGTGEVVSQIYLIFCLTVTGGLTVFVGGNMWEHKMKALAPKKNGKTSG